MSYGDSVRLDMPHEKAVQSVRDALSEQGFGVLTEIDVRQTLKAKLGEEMEDYVILGACNPALAHRALEVDRSIGLLLPCNVVVRGADGGTVVEVLDPQVMVSVPDEEQLRPVADEARKRLTAALESLTA
ncbi:MAG TPA: DUF302 domain-containing protein [Actinomycetes bacterium]|nr:DUF302 domain-containing protein [Actinomycetes bacterium]